MNLVYVTWYDGTKSREALVKYDDAISLVCSLEESVRNRVHNDSDIRVFTIPGHVELDTFNWPNPKINKKKRLRKAG